MTRNAAKISGRFVPNFRPCFRTGSVACSKSAAAPVEHWSLTTLREKLVKIGAKVVSHGRYVTSQMAEVAMPRNLFREILRLIDDLRPRPAPA